MHIELLYKQQTMKIMLIFRFFYYVWFIDSKNLFHSYLKKNDKDLTFNIVHFPNFETNASL